MVRITMNCYRASLWPILTIMISILTLATQSEAIYSLEPSNPQQALYDYYLQATGDPLRSSFNGGQHGPIPFNDAAAYKLEPDMSQSSLGYLIPPQKSAPRLDLIDVQKLVAYLKQLQTEEDELSSANDAVASDLNSHLSPTDPMANTISGPINDPADFEAVLSQLTSAINHEVPNSSNRSEVLDNLLSVYLGSIMQQLKQQQPDDNDSNSILSGEDNNNIDSDTTTEPELFSRSSSSPSSASRYGNGEYIDHPLAIIGHQYVQGGAGEGRQLLGPDGSFENVQVVKSDHAVPSYCDPPNPCPIGYTAEDGCLEKFVNSASFSREYQVKQQCSYDNEHSLFNCDSPVSTMKNQLLPSTASSSHLVDSTDASQQGGDGEATDHLAADKLDTLARTIQNRFGGLTSVRNLIEKHENEAMNQADEHYLTIEKKGSHIGPNFKY